VTLTGFVVANGLAPPPAVNQAMLVIDAEPLVDGDAVSVKVVGPPVEDGAGALTEGQPAGVTVTCATALFTGLPQAPLTRTE
jgi:hypothetical protein